MTTYPSAVEALVGVALTFEGYVEGPRNNETPFGEFTGHNFQPWCDSFVSYVADLAGLGAVIPASAWVPGRVMAARAAGRTVRTPARGDLLCFDWQRDGECDHIGICLGYEPASQLLHTLEGNTSPSDAGSQSNGGGVYRRTRRLSQVGAIIRPTYPTGEWTVQVDLTDNAVQTIVNRIGGGKAPAAGGAFYRAKDGAEQLVITDALTRLLQLQRQQLQTLQQILSLVDPAPAVDHTGAADDAPDAGVVTP